ncbi:MAG: patatin-like phospholipase family protein [Candidatus Buchananbacteria bacterium]|nr:patatin-like phospholipase family protein [Candidatus Buchananbacteria bacterium]
MTTDNNKKIGLALGGGFIRGTAQIGVIEVLEENNIPIDLVAGCSSGSAVAGAYAAGTLPHLKKRLLEGSRKDYFDVIFEPAIPREGFLKGERNKKFFEEFVGNKTFDQLDKKLIIAATNLSTMQQVWLDSGEVSFAIRAATAVPGVFTPMKRDGQILVDGGNFNLIPSEALYENGAEYVIAVDVSQPPNIYTRTLSNIKKLKKRQTLINLDKYLPKTNLHLFSLIARAVHLSSSQIHKFYHDGYKYDYLIHPELIGVKRWSVKMVDYCIKQGRKATLEALLDIKKDLGL